MRILLVLVLMVFAGVSNAQPRVAGYWKTIDDETGEAKSIVKISQGTDNKLHARVVRLLKEPAKRCKACKGSLHNQPIKGMEVMNGLMLNLKKPDVWENGSILDPKTGKTYHCNLQLAKNGQKLTVRGYIGLPILGRSQTWHRVAG